MGVLVRLTLRQLAGPRRLVLLGLLALVPVLITAVVKRLGHPGRGEFTDPMVDGMVVAAVLPIVIMALATAAFGNELEDRTLSYLVLKPVPRWHIVASKFLAVLLVGWPLVIVPSAVAVAIASHGDLRTVAAVAMGLTAGLATYASVFLWAGLVTSRALGFALVYVFLWEGILASFLEGVRYLSARGYTLGIMYALDGQGLDALGPRAIQLPAAAAGAAAVTVVFLLLSVRRLREMDVP